MMKLTTCILFVCCLHVSARSVSQTVTASFKQATLKKVFSEIEKQTPYVFWYDDQVLKAALAVTANVHNADIKKVLDAVLASQQLSYTIEANVVVIRRATEKQIAANVPYYTGITPPGDIYGRVTDSAGQPLAAASVAIKGAAKGTYTNADGHFHLSGVPGDAVLIVSFAGFVTQELSVQSSETTTPAKRLSVRLKNSDNKLDEIQVIAYGQTSKRLNTGNVSTVKAEDIQKQPVGNVLAALDGKVPGMLVTQTTGLPGGSFRVEVRGRTAIDRTITNDQPLFIVDGVPMAAGGAVTNSITSAIGTPSSTVAQPTGLSPLNLINPSDIESIEVLKDADATAIYGSRGANGVIIITTRKPKAGSAQLDVNFNSGAGFVANPVEMMNTQQYVAMRKQAFAGDNLVPDASNAVDITKWDTTRYTNFPQLMAGNHARVTDTRISYSGGKGNNSFLIGASYRKEGTVMPGDFSDQRYGAHWAVHHTSAENKLKMSFAGNYAVNNNNMLLTDMSSYMDLPPNLLVYLPDGSLGWNDAGILTQNPLAYLNQKFKATTKNLNANLLVSYRIARGLELRSSFGYNNMLLNENRINPSTASNPASAVSRNARFGRSEFNSWIIEPQAEYTTTLLHGRLQTLIGGTLQSNQQNQENITLSGQSSDDLLFSYAASRSITLTNSNAPYKYQSMFGRVNYNLKDKYLLNISLRRDGSSRFGDRKRYAGFAAAGAAWIFSEEAFIKQHLTFLSFGKVRASYGVTGNDKISNYQYLDTWRNTTYVYDAVAGLYPDKLYNPDYRWEKTTKLELALEWGLWHDRMLFNVAYYNNRSSNQLVQYKLPYTTGFTSIVTNLPALIENKGYEIMVTTENVQTNNFKWSTSFNMSIPSNKLLSFPGLKQSTYANTYVEGEPLNLIYKYRYTGIDPATGWNTVEDYNKDGAITIADNQALGKLDPVYYGGMQNSFRLKQFQFSFLLSFRKQTGKNYLGSITSPWGSNKNLPANMSGFWQKPGDQAILARLSATAVGAPYVSWNTFFSSDGIYSDASFVRLRNVYIAYSLPPAVLRKLSAKNVTLYVQGQNLFTLTSYETGDPEIQQIYTTPPLTSLTAGIQVSF